MGFLQLQASTAGRGKPQPRPHSSWRGGEGPADGREAAGGRVQEGAAAPSRGPGPWPKPTGEAI